MGEHQVVTATPETLATASAVDAFGADLHMLLGADGGNTVFSPSSIAAALHAALAGARGETAAEIAAVLHVAGGGGTRPGGTGPGEESGGSAPREGGPGGKLPDVAGRSLRLLSGILSALSGGTVTFRAPNTVWIQSGLPLQPRFTAAIGAGADVREADFAHAADAARRTVNAAIAEQTAGTIPDLLAPGGVGARTRLLLASAVYLKAPWAEPFPPGATDDAPFHLLRGGETAVAMMRLETRLNYLRGDGYQAAVLPYADGRLGMAVILPDGPLSPLEGTLAARGVGGLLRGAAPERVRLRLPRFRHEAGFRLVPALGRLGAGHAFADDADFSGMTTATGLAISDIVHRAFIDVDEAGTEAAAATGVVMRAAAFARPSGPVIEMTVDRPFLFAITDTGSGLPVFLGRVTEPSGGAGAALRH